MSNALAIMKNLENDAFDLLDRVEEPLVSLTGSVADAVADFVPERPALPFVTELPTLSELVEHQIALAQRLVDVQAEFAHAWLAALKPVTAKVEATPSRARVPKRGVSAAKSGPKAA